MMQMMGNVLVLFSFGYLIRENKVLYSKLDVSLSIFFFLSYELLI